MKLKFPLTPKIIREGMQEIISDVQKETGWDLQRNLADVTISIGDAPEYFESFGVVRSESEIVFGEWINTIEPDYNKRNIGNFLIIREACSLFFSPDILFKDISQLTDFFLNFAAASFIQTKSKSQSIEPQIALVKTRFLFPSETTSKQEKDLLIKIDSLLTLILTQGISYSLILNTYKFFIEDFSLEDINFDEIISDFTRYLAVEPLSIAAPIHLSGNATNIITELAKSGYATSYSEIARRINIDISIISREISKLASRYKSKWFIERNWKRMGLHSYLLFIKIEKQKKDIAEKIIGDLSSTNYIRRIYKGENEDFLFIYSTIESPHIFIENLSLKFEKYLKENSIVSIETKIIRNKIYRTTIVDKDFNPTVNSFKDLLSNSNSKTTLDLWNFDKFSDTTPIIFSKNDKNMLRIISILFYDSIVGQGLYGVHVKELNKFFEDNNIDSGNITESINFIKKYQNEALKKNLIDFRISISLSNLQPSNYLVFRIKHLLDLNIEEIVNKLSIFGWMLIQYTSDSIIIIILGLDFQNPLIEIIKQSLSEYNLEIQYFSMKNILEKFVPFDSLYNFDTKKWVIE